MKIKLLLFATIIVLFASCKKEDSGPQGNQGYGNVLDEGVMVLNEGQFFANNSSITLFNTDGERSDGIFNAINEKTLGDILHSVTETKSYYYLVVNNSSKIEVVGKNDFKSVATIEGFKSPRYLLDLENGKALVSNFIYDTADVDMKLDIVNLNNHTIEGNIVVNNWCETMLLKGETIWVANTGMDRILLIDKSTLTIKSEVSTPKQPYQMIEDKNGKVWVLCKGDVFNGIPATLICMSSSGAEIKRFEFLTGPAPEKIAINGGGGTLYVLTDKVFKLSVSSPSISLSPIPGINDFTYAYGLGVDPVTNDIYIGDAKDFVSNGSVKVFDNDGNQITSFESGINPNGFVFR